MTGSKCAVCLLLYYESPLEIATVNGTVVCKNHVGHVANADILSCRNFQEKKEGN